MPPVLSSQMRQVATSGTSEGPPPGTVQTVSSGVVVALHDNPVPRDLRTSHDYFELMGAVGELNGKSLGDYRPWSKTLNQFIPFSSHLDVYDLDLLWGDIAEIKRRDPKALPGISTREVYEKKEMQGGAGIQEARTALGRGNPVAGFAGQVLAAPLDPSNWLGAGAAAKTLVGAIGLAATENAVIELAQEPLKRRQAEMAGEERGLRDVVWDVGVAAGGGAVIGGSTRAIGDNWASIKAAPKAVQEKVWAQIIARAPASLRERLAGKMDWDALDDALPELAESVIGRDNMSMATKGAVAQVRRESDIAANNPFLPDGAGVEAHRAAYLRAVNDVHDEVMGIRRAAERRASPRAGSLSSDTAMASGTVTVPGKPGQVGYANDIYQYFRSKGLTDAQARGIAAGIHAESASNHNVRGGYKGRAVGLGQWLGERRAELLRRYGPNPTRRQQLDFMWEELQGRDVGGRAVLAATDERAVLDAYIRKFMRPAPGAQTTGDLTRGMAALGRGGETMRIDETPAARAGDVDPDADARARLAEARDQLEAEQAAFDAEAAVRRMVADDGSDAAVLRDLLSDPEFEVPPMPELRRELFPDETSWRIAQAQLDAETMGFAAPTTRQSVWIDARDELIAAQEGEVRGALFHPDVGPIDVKYGMPPAQGRDGFGLAKIVDKHPEVLEDLPALLEAMEVKSRTDNRVVLESPDHKAVVRLEWDGAAQTWLLSAYQRKGKAPPQRTTDVPGMIARDGSPTREAAVDIGENATPRNAAGPVDVEALAATKGWDDAGDSAAVETADSVVHDLDALHGEEGEAVGFYLDDDGKAVSWSKLREELDLEASEIAAVRGCL